jgi:hypothetical protein
MQDGDQCPAATPSDAGGIASSDHCRVRQKWATFASTSSAQATGLKHTSASSSMRASRPEFTRLHFVARLAAALLPALAACSDALSPAEQACRRGPVARAEIVAGAGQITTIFTAVPILPVVRFLDASGQPVGCVIVHSNSSARGSVLLPLVDTTDDDGLIRVQQWVVGAPAGEQVIAFATPDRVSALLRITVSPGPPAAITLVGPEGRGYMGQPLGTVTASVTDAGDNALQNVPVTFAAAGAKPSLSATSVVTNARGEASVAIRLDTVGTSTISASVANLPTATFQVSATGFRAQGLVMGGHRACGYRSGDTRWFCWGYERDRPLAFGPVQGSVTIGTAHVCGLVTANGGPRCWGGNASGELGIGAPSPPPPGYAVDPLGPAEVPLFIGGAYAIFAGFGNTCAFGSLGNLWCWGTNANGLLGDPASTPSVYAPIRLGMPIRFDSLRLNRTTACGIDSQLITYCWGRNQNGEIGDGTTIDRWNPTRVASSVPFVALSGSCALASSGAAYCWGANGMGHVGDGTTTDRLVPTAVAGGLRFKSISTGNRVNCGISTAGRVYCWGDGQLVPREVALPDGKLATAIGTAEASVCVIAVSDEVFCWGDNDQHDLGDGTTIDRTVPVPVMPVPLP